MGDESEGRRNVFYGPETEGILGDDWVERPFTVTLQDHEILKGREKFTVYKILVIGSQGGSWIIFRRYGDFRRLRDKLKALFPSVRLVLPPKRWFKDNYDGEFLDERRTGLQTFLQNLTCHNDISNSVSVRQFLCVSESPGPFDSLEESRAFCAALEETNHYLQRELMEKQREVEHLRETLNERTDYINFLMKKHDCVSLLTESQKSS
ncbi:sorting nexin-16-like [Hippocampus comes]|uniref:sorting nexin-16-like n=1 Tax=Hippocampus comes TaxID=109280 RepID=UPI00094E92F9|nr:PREDICTED: sorting nexin-16-like [Hippocampus comes]